MGIGNRVVLDQTQWGQLSPSSAASTSGFCLSVLGRKLALSAKQDSLQCHCAACILRIDSCQLRALCVYFNLIA